MGNAGKGLDKAIEQKLLNLRTKKLVGNLSEVEIQQLAKQELASKVREETAESFLEGYGGDVGAAMGAIGGGSSMYLPEGINSSTVEAPL